MACEQFVGVKNIMITFIDCDTGERTAPLSHKPASEDLPVWRTCEWNNEAMPFGYMRRIATNARVEISVIRDTRFPLSWYQGCKSIDMQVEYENGIVMTGLEGSATGDDASDTHEVAMVLSFREVDELLPAGALAA